jgi:hypothetical protein
MSMQLNWIHKQSYIWTYEKPIFVFFLAKNIRQ